MTIEKVFFLMLSGTAFSFISVEQFFRDGRYIENHANFIEILFFVKYDTAQAANLVGM